MERRSFVASVLTAVASVPFINFSDIFKDEIRSKVESGVQKLGLKWSKADIDALTEEVKDVISDKTNRIQKEYEENKESLSKDDLEKRIGNLHDFVGKQLDKFLEVWKKDAEENGFLNRGYIEMRDSPAPPPKGKIGDMKRSPVANAMIKAQAAARKERLNK